MQKKKEDKARELPFTLIKAGFMTYRGEELGMRGGKDFVRLYYPKELLAKDSVIKSFCYQPITMEHEGGFIQEGEENPFVRGMVTQTWFNPSTEAIEGMALITEPSLIKKIESGEKVEISGGWLLDLAPYGEDYIATDMEGNHVSVVKQGRCGGFCHIRSKKKEGENIMSKEEIAKPCPCKEESNTREKTHWVYNRAVDLKMEERLDRLEALIQSMQADWSSKVEDIRGLSQKVESLNGLNQKIEEHKNYLKEKSEINNERLREISKKEYRKKDKNQVMNEAFAKFYQSEETA